MEYTFGELLEALQKYLAEHEQDTNELGDLTITESTELPRADFAVREAAGDLIKVLHSYDEFLRQFGGWAIAAGKDFATLDILRNHLEHSHEPLPMCYIPNSRASLLGWDLVLDLATLIADLERTGKLMDFPRLDKLNEWNEDGIINLTYEFEVVLFHAIGEYVDISKEIGSEANKSVRKLKKLTVGDDISAAEAVTIKDIIQFYVGENSKRRRLARENKRTLKHLTK